MVRGAAPRQPDVNQVLSENFFSPLSHAVYVQKKNKKVAAETSAGEGADVHIFILKIRFCA